MYSPEDMQSGMEHLGFEEAPSVGFQTQEITCQRSVAGPQFPAGVQDFSWSISRPNVWLPGKSYLVAEVELLGAGDPATATQPNISELLALSENAVANCYTSAYLYAGGATLDSVSQDLPQISSVISRTNSAWAQNKSIGSSEISSASFAERCAAVSSTACLPVSQADRGGAGLVGINVGEGKETFVRPCAPGAFGTATVACLSGAPSVVTGVNTAFTSALRGGRIFVNGVDLGTISLVANATTLYISPSVLQNPSDLTATANWYIAVRNRSRTISGKNKMQVIFKPPLGAYHIDSYLPPGQYRLSLGPNSNYRFSAVETLNDAAVSLPSTGATCPYTFNVLDVRMYVSTAQKEIVDGVQPHLHLMEYQSFSRTMNATSASYNFTIPPSTEEVYVGLQHPSAGSNPLWSPARFAAGNDGDLNIIGIQVTYAGQTKPPTRTSSGYANEDPAGRSKAYLTGLYYQSLIELGSTGNPGGAESLDQWLQRGPLYCFRFNKDAMDRSTELSVQLTYGSGPLGAFPTDSKVFVIARYRAKRQLTVSNGQVAQIVAIDA